MITDTHCHLYKEFYENIDEVVENAINNGVTRFISDADNIKTCYEMIDMSKKYDNFYYTLGIHPSDAHESFDELKKIVEENIDDPKFVAIGEIGLDYHYGKDDKEEQIELFNNQLKLAEDNNLPVVIHSREATLDTLNILKKYKLKGVIHCFSGSLETAREFIKMGYYIGVGGVLTFKNSKIDEVIKELPIDRIVVETDSPFLTPEPNRGKKNEPKYVKDVVIYLSKITNIEYEELVEILNNNTNNVFDF